MKKLTLFSGYYQGECPFGMFDKVETVVSPKQMHDKGVLILWGGADISPSIYNQPVVKAQAQSYPSPRDVIEVSLYRKAVELGILIVGICRGAQLACALSGGTLYQHIDGGHHDNHEVETFDGNVFVTSSCHHQALNLENVNHQLLAWDRGRKTMAHTDTHSEMVVIPEVAWLSDTKTLAIQGHPEWMNQKSSFVRWCAEQLTERI